MGKIEGVVVGVAPLTERIRSMTVAAVNGGNLPDWQAGSHVDFDVPGGVRSYSLVSFDAAPQNPAQYTIAVQREDDGLGGSRAMHSLSVGDKITFSAPKNNFAIDPTADGVLLAGGIGVTPLISMAAALKTAGQNVTFHFSGRSADVMAFRQALSDHWQHAFHLHCDDAESKLDLDAVIASVGDAHLYVCGPRGLLDATRAKAEAAGIPASRVHFELFEAAAAQDGDRPFEVQINDGSVYTIPVGKSILEVLEEHDVDVIYDCQRGDCGICQCDVLEGIPDHRDVVLSEAERAAGDVMQICVSRAKSARLVLDI